MEHVAPEVSPLAGLVDKVEPEYLAYFTSPRKPEELAAFAASQSNNYYVPEVQE